MRWEAKLMCLLVPLVLASAVTVVVVKHNLRTQFTDLQHEIRKSDAIAVEWGRLQLEVNTLASHSRIEPLARKKLRMQSPQPEQIIYLKP